MDVSENNGTSKSSILIGFSIVNHPFRVPLFLETPTCCYLEALIFLIPPTFGLRLSAAWKRSANYFACLLPADISCHIGSFRKKKHMDYLQSSEKLHNIAQEKILSDIVPGFQLFGFPVVKCSFHPEGDPPKKTWPPLAS